MSAPKRYRITAEIAPSDDKANDFTAEDIVDQVIEDFAVLLERKGFTTAEVLTVHVRKTEWKRIERP